MADIQTVPLLGPRFDAALLLASSLHSGQKRKGTDTPYLSHLLAVSATVIMDGGGETEAIAGLLHDGPEDQGGEATLRLIEARFGSEVAEIVEDCSETFETPKPPWLARKRAYLRKLDRNSISRRALLVSAADKRHNLASIINDHADIGKALWERFNAAPGDQREYYNRLADIYQRRLPSPLASEVGDLVRRLTDITSAYRASPDWDHRDST
jgi:(p)ppGpp synthase/HD superfamily hydrolase